jgi:transcriptional regulator with XRE-family HTH domain
MSTPSPQTRLAELLDELGLSQAELARRSRISIMAVARAVHGEQTSATGRTRIIGAINARRQELGQTELSASDIFPLS